jgi:hypothetical protein
MMQLFRYFTNNINFDKKGFYDDGIEEHLQQILRREIISNNRIVPKERSVCSK